MKTKDQRFYFCTHCGNLVQAVHASGVELVCCGEAMKELAPNVTEAAQEKHLPVLAVEGDAVRVEVGSVAHPMIDEHHIEWIYLETEKGWQFRLLEPGDSPKAVFHLEGDHAVAAYAYCNIHGLWKTAL